MSDLFRPTKIVTGTRRVPVRPPRTVRPPTESGNAPNLTDIRTFDNCDAVSSSFTWYVPSSFVSGDLLFAEITVKTATISSTPSGWTLLDSHAGAGSLTVYLYAKKSDGTEVDTTQSITSGDLLTAIYWGINANGKTLPDPGSIDIAGTQPVGYDPVAITPAGGAGDYIVMVVGGYNKATITAPPSGYTEQAYVNCVGALDPKSYLATNLVSIVTSEDPGAITVTGDSAGSRTYVTWTLAVSAEGADPDVAAFDHTHTLTDSDITDVDVSTTAPTIGDLLEYDGTDWVPQYRDRYVATASKTIANTTTETTLFGTGEGTLTFPADFFSAGRTVKFRLSGQLTDTGTPNQTIRIKLGGSTLTSETEALSGVSGVEWVLDGTITCRTAGASGTFIASALFDYDAGSEISLVGSSTTTLDTTGTLTFDLTWQWGTADASNTVTCQTAIVS